MLTLRNLSMLRAFHRRGARKPDQRRLTYLVELRWFVMIVDTCFPHGIYLCSWPSALDFHHGGGTYAKPATYHLTVGLKMRSSTLAGHGLHAYARGRTGGDAQVVTHRW